jgi:hypothetical protein
MHKPSIVQLTVENSQIYSATYILWSQDSLVSTAIGYWLEGQGSIPGMQKTFLF